MIVDLTAFCLSEHLFMCLFVHLDNLFCGILLVSFAHLKKIRLSFSYLFLEILYIFFFFFFFFFF